MSIILAANNAGTTLAGSLSPTATTVALAVGTGSLFPQPTTGQFYVATLIPASSTTGLPCEIVHVTAMAGDTATIVRAQEGTTALTFSVGDLFQNLWTAGSFATLVQSGQLQAQAGNWAVDTGSANAVSISLSPALTSLSQVIGIPIRIKKSGNSNTAATTLTVNGLGPIAILSNNGLVAMWSGALQANNVFQVVYDGTQWELISNVLAAPNSVANAQLVSMGANTVKMNNTGVTASPQDISIATFLTALGFSTTTSGAGTAIKFGSFIIQMGVTAAVSENSGIQTITLPLAMNAVYAGGYGATLVNSTGGTSSLFDNVAQVVSCSATQIQLMNQAVGQQSSASAAFPINWFVIGHS